MLMLGMPKPIIADADTMLYRFLREAPRRAIVRFVETRTGDLRVC